MNCPACKSPISNNTTQCEWCGKDIEITEPVIISEDSNIENERITHDKENISLSIIWPGTSSLFTKFTTDVQFFVDEFFISSGKFSDGFTIKTRTKNNKPQIKFSYDGGSSKEIQFPVDLLFFIGESYIIYLREDWKGKISTTPEYIKKI